MGGEPTFVSIDDRTGGRSGRTTSLGDAKRQIAGDLLKSIAGPVNTTGADALRPGQALPRRAAATLGPLSLPWRVDGVPVWRNRVDDRALKPQRIRRAPTTRARVQRSARRAPRHHAGASCCPPSRTRPTACSRKASCPTTSIRPIRRSTIRRNARASCGASSGSSRPAGRLRAAGAALDRAGGARLDQRSLAAPRRGRLFLVPGDSPIGFRLPLSSLPHVAAGRLPASGAGRPVRAARRCRSPEQASRGRSVDAASDGRATAVRVPLVPERRPEAATARAPIVPETAGMPVRTALAVEPRDGRLCVFMPPTETAADYLDVLSSIEDAAAELERRLSTSKAIRRPTIRG